VHQRHHAIPIRGELIWEAFKIVQQTSPCGQITEAPVSPEAPSIAQVHPSPLEGGSADGEEHPLVLVADAVA
jgi:hypothetical protein